ncbi:MAG: hypothetical protein ACI8ZM_000576 [Crocinitomix sp.]|jgi:hypothetical protein
MAKNLIFILFLFCSFYLQAHPILDGLEKSYQSRKYSDLTTYLDGLLDNFSKEITYKSRIDIDREIIDCYYEFKIEIEQNTAHKENAGTYSVDRYIVRIIRLHNTIIHFQIEEKIYVQKGPNEWVQEFKLIKEKADSVSYQKLETSYFVVYNSDLNFADLFEDKIVYGSHCGYAGQDPIYREQLNLYIQKRDKKELQKWLVSATAELQLYAIDGILNLSKKGIRFKDKTYALIEIIANKEGTVNSCAGCTHWNTTIKSEVENLLKKHGLLDLNSIRRANFSQDSK